MKKNFVYGVIFFCAIVLQTSVLPTIFSSSVGDVLLMMILAGSILDGFSDFIWWTVLVGIVYDLVSYTAIGLHAVIFLFVLYFVSFFSRRFSVELKGVGLVLFFLFVIVATLISRAAVALLIVWDLQTFAGYFDEVGSLRFIATQILFNTLLFSLCFIILKKAKIFFAID